MNYDYSYTDGKPHPDCSSTAKAASSVTYGNHQSHIQYGWVCPQCGRTLSPWTSSCPCHNTDNWTITCGSGTAPATPNVVVTSTNTQTSITNAREAAVNKSPLADVLHYTGTSVPEIHLKK